MGPLEITSRFSLTNTKACLEASEYVYQHDCGIASDLAHADMLETPNARILAWRGTACGRDWLTDVRIAREPWPMGGRVHAGFHAAFRSVEADVLQLVNCGKRPLFVTGHSLGAAMAVLSALSLEKAGQHVQAVYTFGGPRVGTAGFAADYSLFLESCTWRVVNEEDIVARVPSWLFGWRHVGTEVFLPSAGNGYVISPALPLKVVSDVWGTLVDWKLGRLAQVTDHSTEQYRERMERIQAQQEMAR